MSEEKRLDMYGGILGGAVPLAVLIIGLVWLCLAERGGTQPFWACAWLALVIGLFFARKKEDYCLAAMRGIGDENGIVIITAWLFAGVFGQLMAAGGLVDGLLWMGMSTGAQGSIFVGLVFFASMLFALGTGTSTGTCIALTPVLYPAGYFLGADPAMLGLAILSGAAFGDNLSPIADTTIVSAYTQGATMKEVVRSRFPLSMSAAVMAMVIFLIFGNADQAAALPDIQKDFDPAGVLMLIALVVVVGSAMMGRHIIESLVYGNVCAAVIAILTGHIKPTEIFGIPAQAGQSTGYIENGILSVVGPIIFAILILAVTQIMKVALAAALADILEQEIGGTSFMSQAVHSVAAGGGLWPGQAAMLSLLASRHEYESLKVLITSRQELELLADIALAAAILLRDRLPEASSFIQARSPQPEPERLLHELCLPS